MDGDVSLRDRTKTVDFVPGIGEGQPFDCEERNQNITETRDKKKKKRNGADNKSLKMGNKNGRWIALVKDGQEGYERR